MLWANEGKKLGMDGIGFLGRDGTGRDFTFPSQNSGQDRDGIVLLELIGKYSFGFLNPMLYKNRRMAIITNTFYTFYFKILKKSINTRI